MITLPPKAKNRWLGPVKTKIKYKSEAKVFHLIGWAPYVSVNIFIILFLAWKAEFYHPNGIIMQIAHNSKKSSSKTGEYTEITCTFQGTAALMTRQIHVGKVTQRNASPHDEWNPRPQVSRVRHQRMLFSSVILKYIKTFILTTKTRR